MGSQAETSIDLERSRVDMVGLTMVNVEDITYGRRNWRVVVYVGPLVSKWWAFVWRFRKVYVCPLEGYSTGNVGSVGGIALEREDD